VATHTNQPAKPSEEIVKRCRAAVRIEMRANDRQLLANFRNAFLQWVNDDASSEFLRSAGVPDTVALEEVAAGDTDHNAKTLRVEVIWDANRGAEAPAAQVSEQAAMPSFSLSAPHGPGGLSSVNPHAPIEDGQFVFFPDPPAADPIYRDVHGPLRASADDRTARAQLVRPLPVVPMQLLAPGWRGLNARTLAAYGAAKKRASRLIADRRVRGAVVLGSPAAILMMATLVYLTLRPNEAPDPPTSTVLSAPVSQLETSRLATQMRREQVLASRTDPNIPEPNRDLLMPRSKRSARDPLLTEPAVKKVDATDPISFVVGTLVVNSEPQGAEVLINGVSQGRTPLRIDGLSAGSRVVRLELPGYERWSWAVRVVANRQTPLVVKLQPEGRRTGAN
jgi:PEGA domain